MGVVWGKNMAIQGNKMQVIATKGKGFIWTRKKVENRLVAI